MTQRSQRGRRRGHGRPTLDDVARTAGVSAITVSRALRTPEKVARETREVVASAIAKVGYIPNLVAGNLASIKTRTIAAIVPTLEHSIFTEMLQGMVDVLRDEGFELILGSSGFDIREEESLIKTFLARQAEGIVLTGSFHTDEAQQLLARLDWPVVETWSLLGTPSVGSVGFSNYDAAYEMVKHLAERGYREIAFVSAVTEANDRAAERLRGVRHALADLGLPERAERIRTSEFSLRAGGESMHAIRAACPETDAIFFAADTLAAGAILEAKKCGISVPDEIAIAGFDDLEIATVIDPPMTTVRVPRRDLGRVAARLLIEATEHGFGGGVRRDLGFELVVRGST